MTRSQMIDCGLDYDYCETISQGDAYEWGYENFEDESDDDSDEYEN